MSLFRKPREERIAYDPDRQEPVIRKSICTGEMTAGLVDRDTGKFHDLMRLEGEDAVAQFCRNLGVDHVRVMY